jgi:hypothetical protein
MSSLPAECPECRKPVDSPRWSRGATFSADIPIPAQCSDAAVCDWEDRFPYVCAHCGSYRLKDAPPQPHTVGRITVITLGRVCADCGEPVAI